MNIRDIAKMAGVSASTVSKVMNGKDRDISKSTRDTVLKIIEENQYVPYLKFREKDGLKSRLIGLIIAENNRERESIILSADRAAREKGYSLVVNCVSSSDDEIAECIRKMEQRNVSGLLLALPSWYSTGKLKRSTVYLGQTKEFDQRQEVTFYYRLSEAGRLAVRRLIDAGHDRIACIVSTDDRSIMNGYKLEMQEHDLPVQPFWMYQVSSPDEVEEPGISQFLNDNITAIICGSWDLACSVYKVMAHNNVSIPENLSLISVGDRDVLSFLGNGLSTVRLPSEPMTTAAIEAVVGMIETDKLVEGERRFAPEMVERSSIATPMQHQKGDPIVVVGSMNMDIIINVDEIPQGGEVQIAKNVYSFPGGKGGNQAVGVGKLGGQVSMIGCLGNDLDGKQLYTSLVENHVNMSGVYFNKILPSGKAYIDVDKKGESTIVVYPGANDSLSISHIKRCSHLFQNAKYCLLSLEIPQPVVEYIIRYCRHSEMSIILKPSVDKPLQNELLHSIDYAVPNEHELDLLVPGTGTLEEKAQTLLDRGVANVIVTRGRNGCYFRNGTESVYFEGSGFKAVDTTGGADSFISAMAVCLSEGRNIMQAIAFAIYASGISVTRHGVQPALPDRRTLDIYEEAILSKYKNYEPKGEKS